MIGEFLYGVIKSVYGVDFDGNEFEVMWLLLWDVWGEYENKGVVECFDFVVEIECWLGVLIV